MKPTHNIILSLIALTFTFLSCKKDADTTPDSPLEQTCRVIRITEKDLVTNIEYSIQYFYDNEKRIIKTIRNNNANSSENMNFTYTIGGKLSTVEIREGTGWDVYEVKFDDNNRIISLTNMSNDNVSIEGMNKYFYNDNNQVVIDSIFRNSSKAASSYSYDSKGNVINWSSSWYIYVDGDGWHDNYAYTFGNNKNPFCDSGFPSIYLPTYGAAYFTWNKNNIISVGTQNYQYLEINEFGYPLSFIVSNYTADGHTRQFTFEYENN